MPTKSEIIEKLARAIATQKAFEANYQLLDNPTKAISYYVENNWLHHAGQATTCFNALSEYVTFVEEGSEPQVGDLMIDEESLTLERVESYDGEDFKTTSMFISAKGLLSGYQTIRSNGKPVITLQKE